MKSTTIFQHLFICLAAGCFVYTKGVTIFDLVSSSSFGDYYKVETFNLTRALLGLWIFHPLLGGGAFERTPP